VGKVTRWSVVVRQQPWSGRSIWFQQREFLLKARGHLTASMACLAHCNECISFWRGERKRVLMHLRGRRTSTTDKSIVAMEATTPTAMLCCRTDKNSAWRWESVVWGGARE
jgi:hypothetical protein